MSVPVPETQTIQLNADGPLASEMPQILQAAIRRARRGGVTRLLDGDFAVAEIVPAQSASPLKQLTDQLRETGSDAASFHDELRRLIMLTSRETNSNTPNHLLARFLETCLKAFEETVQYRDRWYGITPSLGTPTATQEGNDDRKAQLSYHPRRSTPPEPRQSSA